MSRKYSKVKTIFNLYPNGLTLNEACLLYKQLYPNEPRDVAHYICGQKSFGNFKIMGIKGDESIYVLNNPSKREKLLFKIEACEKMISQSKVTLEKTKSKLLKLDSTGIFSPNQYDFDPSNTTDGE